MSEYIDRDAALVALQDSDLFNTTERQLRAIRELPAADVAPVVRCKDCIYRINGRCFSRTSFLNAPAVEPDNFCSWGATE